MSKNEHIWKEVLLYLLDEQCASSGKVADHFKVGKQKSSNVLFNLKTKGLVHKVNYTDFALTERGKEVLAQHFPAVMSRLHGNGEQEWHKVSPEIVEAPVEAPEQPETMPELPMEANHARMEWTIGGKQTEGEFWREQYISLVNKIVEKL